MTESSRDENGNKKKTKEEEAPKNFMSMMKGPSQMKFKIPELLMVPEGPPIELLYMGAIQLGNELGNGIK